MKFLAAIAICGALGLSACGSSSEPSGAATSAEGSTQDDGDATRLPTKARTVPQKPPTIRIPPGPPPKNLVVRDLKEGYGVAAKLGQRLGVQHVGVNYKTGEVFETFWGKTGPFSFNFGAGEVREGWETGLKGLRVGGRRELILPSRLAYDTGALAYVVELLEVEP